VIELCGFILIIVTIYKTALSILEKAHLDSHVAAFEIRKAHRPLNPLPAIR